MTGSRRSARERCELGIGMFVEDGAYTVVSAAVSILVVLTLVFSSATAAGRCRAPATSRWPLTRRPSRARTSWRPTHTVATVMDACALSLGLAGFAVSGAGLAGMLVPGGTELASKLVDIGGRCSMRETSCALRLRAGSRVWSDRFRSLSPRVGPRCAGRSPGRRLGTSASPWRCRDRRTPPSPRSRARRSRRMGWRGRRRVSARRRRGSRRRLASRRGRRRLHGWRIAVATAGACGSAPRA